MRTPASAQLEGVLARSARDLLALASELHVLAVDIPIGLADRGRRACDHEARKLLGWPRCQSVFPAPVRPALSARSRRQASRITSRVDGRRVGAQAWALYPKIREMDAALRSASPGLRRKIFEIHPEVSFWAWNRERPMAESKKTPAGRSARLRLVRARFGHRAYDFVREAFLRKDVADDDILDAFAALWTAERIFCRQARTLPARPPRDAMDLTMAITY